jgi:hypothetical protein
MTLLGKEQSEGSSYLELAQFLNIDDNSPEPDLHRVLATAPYYGLQPQQAQDIVANICHIVSQRHELARRLGLSAPEVNLMAPAYAAADHFASVKSIS